MKKRLLPLLLFIASCAGFHWTPSHDSVREKLISKEADYRACYDQAIAVEVEKNKLDKKDEGYLFDLFKQWSVTDKKTYLSGKVFAIQLRFKKHLSGRISDFKVSTEESLSQKMFNCLEKTTREADLPSPQKKHLKRMDYIEMVHSLEFYPPQSEKIVGVLKKSFMSKAWQCFEKVPSHKPRYGTVDIVLDFEAGKIKKREYLLRPGTPSFLDLMFPCLDKLFNNFPQVTFTGKFILPFNTYSGFKAFLDKRETSGL